MQDDLIIDAALSAIPNPSAKVVYIQLAIYSNAEGKCFPSQPRLALETGMSERSVRNAIKWLIDNNYLTCESRHNASNKYTLNAMKEYDMDHEEKFASEIESNITRLDISKSNSNTTSAAKFAAPKSKHPNDSPAFLAFWQVYPRKIGKGAARTAFKKASSFADVNEIIEAASAYAKHCEESGTERQYIPHPSTWLNQERWEDDLELEKVETKKAIGDFLNDI